jgi:hypothetical protein
MCPRYHPDTGVEIGEPRRTITIEPVEEPAPSKAPVPSPAPEPDRERERTVEPAKATVTPMPPICG